MSRLYIDAGEGGDDERAAALFGSLGTMHVKFSSFDHILSLGEIWVVI